MIQRTLPSPEEMYRAFVARDTHYDGIFLTGVKTTGIFCRPSCPAKKPLRKNVDFFRSAGNALAAGFRACKRCRPLEPAGNTPASIGRLLQEVASAPTRRIRDRDLRARGLEPATVRRWFKEHHDMTFHAYQRQLRLGLALRDLEDGAQVSRTAFASGYDSLSGFQEAVQKLTGSSPSQSRNITRVHLTRTSTPLGTMLVGATDEALCLLEFTDRRMLETQLDRISGRLDCTFIPGANQVIEQLEAELEQYFSGTLREFRTPLLLSGTDFQKRVWGALRRIPYAETRSYAEQASMIESPKAVRAVGRANGANRIAIVIPCHRVVGADGKLTGYGGGLWRKKYLLEHERQFAAEAGTPRLDAPPSSASA